MYPHFSESLPWNKLKKRYSNWIYSVKIPGRQKTTIFDGLQTEGLSHGAPGGAVRCMAFIEVLTHRVCAATAQLLRGSVDDKCCQLSAEDSLLR